MSAAMSRRRRLLLRQHRPYRPARHQCRAERKWRGGAVDGVPADVVARGADPSARAMAARDLRVVARTMAARSSPIWAFPTEEAGCCPRVTANGCRPTLIRRQQQLPLLPDWGNNRTFRHSLWNCLCDAGQPALQRRTRARTSTWRLSKSTRPARTPTPGTDGHRAASGPTTRCCR